MSHADDVENDVENDVEKFLVGSENIVFNNTKVSPNGSIGYFPNNSDKYYQAIATDEDKAFNVGKFHDTARQVVSVLQAYYISSSISMIIVQFIKPRLPFARELVDSTFMLKVQVDETKLPPGAKIHCDYISHTEGKDVIRLAKKYKIPGNNYLYQYVQADGTWL